MSNKKIFFIFLIFSQLLLFSITPVFAKNKAIWFSHFNKNMLPEGLTYCSNSVYVGIATTQEIYRVLKNGKLKLFAHLPKLEKKTGVMTGIICGKNGELYAALDSKNKKIPSGVYVVSKNGGKAKLFASNKYLVFPNGFSFDKNGDLYTTDSLSNSILKIMPTGEVIRWAYGKLFAGNPKFCPQRGAGKIIGANGIAIDKLGKNIYVTNTDKASLIKIPILKNGLAGKPKIIFGPNCNLLAGADGLVEYKKKFLIAVNRQNKIISINKKTLSPSLVYQGLPLSFPASLITLHTSNGDKLLTTNFSLITAIKHPGKQIPGITVIALE